jgi:ABC-type nitrate/sulfonate/bicarbonate transport system substrate-binding protein
LFCVRASADERVRMALSVRNVVFLPFYYAKDTKIYDKHGLNVELIQMRSDLQLAGLVLGKSILRRRSVPPAPPSPIRFR